MNTWHIFNEYEDGKFAIKNWFVTCVEMHIALYGIVLRILSRCRLKMTKYPPPPVFELAAYGRTSTSTVQYSTVRMIRYTS